MNYHILTLFPEMVMGGLKNSIIGRAMEKELITAEAVNIRDYSADRHHHVDDYPYGGGAGMVMQPGPVVEAYEALSARIGKRPRVIYMTPQGRVFTQKIAEELAREDRRAGSGADCDGLPVCGRLCADRRRASCYGDD